MPVDVTKILLVEDNQGDARLIREHLAEIAELRFEVTHRETVAQALRALSESKPDAVLVDLGLPDAEQLGAVRQLRKAAPDVPLVVLTGLDDQAMALEALQEGAQDYAVKGKINATALSRILRYAMQRHHLQEELHNLTLVDDLTGLYNRRGFLALAEQQRKVAARNGKGLLLIFADLDGMKQINDCYGHQEGNRALVETSGILRDCFRQSDILARLGGDEFAVLAINADEEHCETVRKRIHQKVERTNSNADRPYQLRLSIGIAVNSASHQHSIEELLAQADALMYEEKNKRVVMGRVPLAGKS
jgi:two-component system cell cycle response regulator